MAKPSRGAEYMNVQELYGYKAVAANSTTPIGTSSSTIFGGFICTTAGNFNLKDSAGNDIIAAVGVVVGQFIPGALACPNGAQVVLSGGAAGTIYIG